MPSRRQKASVLLIVLVTIAFASAALIAFMERADDDLIVPMRQTGANRMRGEAYAALETVLAVLVDFRAANNNNLRHPAEGWDDPLHFDWVNYTPANPNRTVTVTFEDESGKMSLPAAIANGNGQNIANFFAFKGLPTEEATLLKDSFLAWTTTYTPTASGASDATIYQQDTIPFTPPRRSLRSWEELRSIDGVKDYFYDSNGALTELGKRFIGAFSLYNFPSSNVNGGKPDTLAVLANLDIDQQRAVLDYLHGGGAGTASIPNLGYFTNAGQVGTLAGVLSPTAGLDVNITALRINVTVKEGLAVYTLSALVTWPGGATATAAPAPPAQATTPSNGTTVTTAPLTTPNLQYPYTILDVTENDLDPAEAAAKAASTEDETPGLNEPALTPTT